MQRTYVNRGAIAVATFIVLCLWLQPPVSAEMRKPSMKPAGQSGALGSFLGLRQAIEIALEKHPVIQAAGANLKAAEARTEQTRSLYYPQVYANFDTISGVGGINPRNGIEVRIDLWVIEGAGLFGAGFGSFEIGAGRLNDRMLLQRDLDGLPQSQKAAQGPALTGRLHRWLPHLRANRGLKPQTKDDERGYRNCPSVHVSSLHGYPPSIFLAGRFACWKIVSRCFHRLPIGQASFAHHNDVLIATETLYDLDPHAVVDTSFDRDLVGFALLDY